MTNPFKGMGHTWHDGSAAKQDHGYHNLPFADYEDAPTHRGGTVQRIRHARQYMNVEGKRGLDIGCSAGGMSFGFQLLGAEMTGVDFDPTAINAATKVEKEKQTGAKFIEMNVPSDEFYEVLSEGWDFTVWLSNFMWIVKQQGYDASVEILKKVCEQSPILLFETAQHQKDGGAGRFCPFNGPQDVAAMLSEIYPSVRDLGVPVPGWGNRTVFICER